MRAGIQDRRALHDIVPYGPVLWPKATLVAAGAIENSRDLALETLSQACSRRYWASTRSCFHKRIEGSSNEANRRPPLTLGMRSEGEAGRIALGYQEVLRMGLSDSPQFGGQGWNRTELHLHLADHDDHSAVSTGIAPCKTIVRILPE